MAEFNGLNLRNWRNAQKVSPVELARIIHKDETAIYRYERGEGSLTPDDMYLICEHLGDLNIWCDWMRTEYPHSYGIIHPSSNPHDLPGAIMDMFAEFADVLDRQREVMRDGADGHIDNAALREWFDLNLAEAVAAGQRLLNMLRS